MSYPHPFPQLRGCSYEHSFLFVFPLNREKDISMPGEDLFWRAITRDSFAENQCSKLMTQT